MPHMYSAIAMKVLVGFLIYLAVALVAGIMIGAFIRTGDTADE